jgi:hypothetical protein
MPAWQVGLVFDCYCRLRPGAHAATCLLQGEEAPRKSRFAFDEQLDSSVALNDDPLARSAFGGDDPLTAGSSLEDPFGGSFSGV